MLTYEFDPQRHIRHIILAGVGGTGAQIARGLARLLHDMQERRMQTPTLSLYDPDRVEARNIGRQLFTHADIGANKAEIVARRLNLTLGLAITAHACPFTAKAARHNASHFYPNEKNILLIGAVDNAEARQELADALHSACAWLDCGNHEHSGQVIIGNNDSLNLKHYKARSAHTTPSKQTKHLTYNDLPAPHIVFPDLLLPDPQPLSCADLAAQNQQAIFINDWMALIALEYTRKLLMREPLRTWITYVNAQYLSTRSVPVAPDEIKQLLAQTKKAQGRKQIKAIQLP